MRPAPPLRAARSSRALVAAGIAWLVAVAGAALVAACGAVGSGPFASFDTRCATLGPARFEVAVVPLTFVEDDTEDVAALTARSGALLSRHRTYGLTSVQFGHSTDSKMKVIEERATGRTCGAPQVRVELSMQPVVVYVASELKERACEHAATREHELRHVAVYREVLEESARNLRADIGRDLGTGVRKAASTAALQAELETTLRDYLARFMRARHAVVSERQLQIDTAEEYARVGLACGH